MTEVEDQSQSNSCCANAVAGAYEYLCKRKALETGDSVGDISRLFIYYVGRKNDQVTWNEDPSKAPKDEGMTLTGAINALQAKGACLMETVCGLPSSRAPRSAAQRGLHQLSNPSCRENLADRQPVTTTMLQSRIKLSSSLSLGSTSTIPHAPQALTRRVRYMRYIICASGPLSSTR